MGAVKPFLGLFSAAPVKERKKNAGFAKFLIKFERNFFIVCFVNFYESLIGILITIQSKFTENLMK